MNNKWILYIGGFEMPDRNAAAQRVIANAKAFREISYETFFIGLSRNKELCGEVKEYEGFNYINFHYPDNIKKWFSYLSSIKPYREYLEKNPEIIIAYNFPAFALEKLHKWKVRKNTQLIADCTEWYEPKGNLLFRFIKGIDTSYRMKKLHPKLDGLIAISDYLYKYYNPRMNNVIQVPPLVDTEMRKWKIEFNGDFIQDEKIIIIYAGSPGGGNKDRIDLVIDALSQLKVEGFSNFQFNIVGITEKQFNDLFGFSVSDNLKINIAFKGRLSHVETLQEIKKAHYYLFLRDNNLANTAGFPTKFVESISCGTPVITNSTSNIEDYIVKGRNGFLIEGPSLNELKNVLKEAIQLPQAQIRMMKNYCYQTQIFNYKNFINDFERLIRNIQA